MAMGKKRTRDRQVSMWVATADLPKSAGHPFYARLNRVLDDAGFDTFGEAQCAQFYADGIGRPSLAPGRYFRLLLLGYFEGVDSERAMAWRAADSLSIRQFLDVALYEAPPDHSTLSRTRRLIDVETHHAVFTWVLQRLADAHLVEGHPIGIDATTLEANAAMRSIVRRDTGDAYAAWLTRLAEASGLATPTRAELARFDRTRKKKGSNDDWTHPHDPDAKITKMKDGRTHLAHTAEHAVDLETGAIVGVTVQDADDGDTTTMVETLITAAEQVEAVLPAGAGVAEVVGDKGYHRNETMVECAEIGVRSYVSEPDRGRRNWKGKAAARKAVYANRRRIRGARGKRLLRQRGELLERPNAHLYETGRLRRVHLRGHPNILKRVLVHSLRFQSRVAHAAADGRRHAAEPPRPRGGPSWRPDRPPGRALGAWAAILGPGAPRPTGFVVGRPGDTSIRTHDPRFTNSPFCHGLPRSWFSICTRLLDRSATNSRPCESKASACGPRNSPGPRPSVPTALTNVPSVVISTRRSPSCWAVEGRGQWPSATMMLPLGATAQEVGPMKSRHSPPTHPPCRGSSAARRPG